MATRIVGTHTWGGSRDSEGHRHYHITYRIEGDFNDGPASVLATSGLPIPGQLWFVANDFDIWAWCRYETEIDAEIEGEPNKFWKITFHFSTKPLDGRAAQNDPDSRREDPLLEPPRISGGFTRQTIQITHDRFGKAIKNSAHEPVRGPEVEFEENEPTVIIEYNTLILNVSLLDYMRDKLNDRPLWGFPKRAVRLAEVTWERKYHGTAFKYYTIKLVFVVNIRGWDRVLLDEGTKALNGEWSGDQWVLKNIMPGNITPDPDNPAHFKRFKDRQGDNSRVVLNGEGVPYVPEQIDVCTACADGMTKHWVVKGTPYGEMVLDHTSVCTYDRDPLKLPWKLLDMRLRYNESLGYWVLTLTIPPEYGELTTVVTYHHVPFTQDNAWQCFGINKMEKEPGGGFAAEGWPDELFVSSGEQSLPGKIHVEYYSDVNFYLLGIPAILG